VATEGQLTQVVRALGTAARLARGLDSRQQQGDQDADDGDDHEQFDQGEPPSSASSESHSKPPERK
jgi:hypothetical protein